MHFSDIIIADKHALQSDLSFSIIYGQTYRKVGTQSHGSKDYNL